MSYDVKKSAEALSSANCANCHSMDRLKMIIEFDKSLLGSDSKYKHTSSIKSGIQFKLQNGEWIGKAHIGYLNIRNEAGKVDIILDPIKSPMIVEIFNLCLAGKSLAFLSEKFNISDQVTSAILSNSFYHGEIRSKKYNKHYPHKYERLISRELFDKCQEVMKAKKKGA